MMESKIHVLLVVVATVSVVAAVASPACEPSCQLPSCSCPRYEYPMEKKQIPQMVYFGFDDAVNVVMAGLYKKLFTKDRVNPNGCNMKMTLFVSHQYTDYSLVRGFHQQGHEVAVHSVTHTSISNSVILKKEAAEQKENIHHYAGVPKDEIVGWRSPFLKTAGNVQPQILKDLGYDYDISLTVTQTGYRDHKPWPFTMHKGWPYSCGIRPCPTDTNVSSFWEVPVTSLMDHTESYPCAFVDGCAVRASDTEEAFEYLWNNFMNYYNSTRAPFGLNMHAAWFYTDYNLEGMKRFLTELGKLDDVYVVTVSQVLDWMKNPTELKNIHNFQSWSCPEARVKAMPVVPVQQPTTQRPTTTKRTTTTPKPTTTTPKPTTTTPKPTTTTTTTTPKPTTTTTTTTPKPTTTTTTTTPKPTTTTTTTTPKPTTTTTTPKPTTTTTTTTPKPTTTTTTTTTTTPTTTTPKPTTTTTTKATTPSTPFTSRPTSHTRSVQSGFLWQTAETLPPLTAGASTSSPFLSNWFAGTTQGVAQRTDWWNSWWNPSGKTTTEAPSAKCTMGENCFLPNCCCQGEAIPNNLAPEDTPQMVFITIDGGINPQVHRMYNNFFRNRQNPNKCKTRGTLYISEAGTFSTYLKAVTDLGAEIGMRGVHDQRYENVVDLEREMVAQQKTLNRRGYTNVRGWKMPDLKSIGDEQFRVVSEHNFLYDATLSEGYPPPERNASWPYTLDYGFTGDCVIPECPTKKFPGLWEIPNVAVKDYKNLYECSYIDGCMFNPTTANETAKFLWDNFNVRYTNNKAPFGIHLRQLWFSHPAYLENLKGLQRFLTDILKLNDVYLVSASDVINWMKNPTKNSDITAKIPWNCEPVTST